VPFPRLLLQCPPLDEFPVNWSWTWTDYDTISSEAYSNPNSRDLATITLDSSS
jgi:hypothetical protein